MTERDVSKPKLRGAGASLTTAVGRRVVSPDTRRMNLPTENAAPDRTLLIVAANSEVIAFRRADGAIAWRQSFPGGTLLGMPVNYLGAMELAFHGGRVYVGARDRIASVSVTGAARSWDEIALPEPRTAAVFPPRGRPPLRSSAPTGSSASRNAGELVWQSPPGLRPLDGLRDWQCRATCGRGDDIGAPAMTAPGKPARA